MLFLLHKLTGTNPVARKDQGSSPRELPWKGRGRVRVLVQQKEVQSSLQGSQVQRAL